MVFKRILFSLFFASTGIIAQAQTWEIGGFLGGAGYMGDLNPINPFYVRDYAFGGLVKRNFDANWGLKFGFLSGYVRGTDAESKNLQNRLRNLNFYSPIMEVSMQLEFNFFEYIPSISKKLYTPYLFVGVGAVAFNPKTKYKNSVYDLALYGTEGQGIEDPYSKIAVTLPYGFGVKYNFAGKWSLGAELGYRTAYTDYIDDVAGNYPDPATLYNNDVRGLSDRSGELTGVNIGVPGTQRGNARNKDTYLFTGFTLTYTFVSRKCPVVN